MILATCLLLLQSGDLDRALAKAEALAAQNQFAGAVQVLEKAGAAQSDHAKALSALGTYQLRDTEAKTASGELTGLKVVDAFNRAAGTLRKACGTGEAAAETYANLSEALLNTSDLRGAAKVVEDGLAKHRNDLALLLQQGRVAFARANEVGTDAKKMEAYQKAAEAYGRARKAHPQSAVACVRLGEVRLWQQDRPAAVACWQEALKRNPAEVDMGAMVSWLGIDASPLLEEHMQRAGEDALLRWYQGLAEYNSQQSEQWPNAKKHFLKALELNPAFTNTWYFLGAGAMAAGTRLQQSGQNDAANREYRFSAKAWGLYLKDFGAHQLGQMAAQEDKGDGFVAQMKWLAGKAIGGNDFETAIHLSRFLVQARPQDVEAWNNLALLYRDTGQAEPSLKAYQKAYSLNPQDPQLMNDLAVIYHYYLKTEDETAKDLYRKAITRAESLLANPEALADGDQERYQVALRDARRNLSKLEAGNRINN
ncbi:MAG: tetratricopeptide repeat protein [Planctomycetota bacterium]|nr:MAG: tetratricopeptide repeat protein [Planctomycetota bacterium]